MTEELLALLEEGPQATAELARWLQRPRLEVAHALRRMATDRLVKQVGTAKLWALAGFAPVPGRKPTLDRQAIRTKVLGEIPPGTLRSTQDVRGALRLSRQAVIAACAALVAEGVLEQHGNGRSLRWARAGTVTVAEAAPAAPAEAPPIDGDDEDVPEGDWPAEELPEDLELGLVPPREPVSRSGVALRQPHERPATVKVTKDQGLSFWVDCDRAELNRRIEARQEQMRNSKAARTLDGNVRNW